MYQKYQFIYHFIIKSIGPVYFVYYLDDYIKNITFHYYSGIGFDEYSNGKYFCKVLSINGIEYFFHDGCIHEIPLVYSGYEEKNNNKCLTRKNIILCNNGAPIEIDLNLLDKYYRRNHSNDTQIDLKLIISCLGFECTHVHFIELKPVFCKKIIPIDEINIHDIYE